ncbi:MAG: ATP-binding protein [Spirochaetales bacterium]|nr:ATP-binding protein [Spirochaetales bacterium]
MVEIRRRHYLDTLGRFAATPSIVAVVGLRRVGKSVLLRQYADEARSSQPVAYVDKESFDFADVRTAEDVIRHVNATSPKGEERLVVLDEVQQIDQWERAVASLNAEARTRVIISGSNASLFSGELATRIAGRYLTLQVFPLTLAEFGALHTKKSGTELSADELLRLYLRLGGLPGLLHTDLSERVTYQMLGDIFNTIAVRDIISRHGIRDVPLFQDVTRFAMDNIGNPVSAKRIADFLSAQRRSASVDTVLNYLAYLDEAYLLNTARRYDLKGKRHLETNAKYYLGDIGLRNGVLGYREADIGGLLENLVYLELRRRGYRVSVGSADSGEIDFVAEGPSGKLYIQVAYLLESRATVERELRAFSLLDDAYPRYLLTLDPYRARDLEGVRHRSVLRFLLGDSLDT